MDRKEFLHSGLIFGAGALSAGFRDSQETKQLKPIPDFLADIPNYCSHEHWGSLFHIGADGDGFTADKKPGALPPGKTTLVDLLMDPYLAGSVMGNGLFPLPQEELENPLDLAANLHQNPEDAFRLLTLLLQNLQLKGSYQVLRLGILFAHDYDLQTRDLRLFLEASERVSKRYSAMFDWYRELMSKARLSNLIRPVQPEFYFADFTAPQAREEVSFTSTLLRIDPFLDFWRERHPRRDLLAGELGIDPVNGPSWKSFLEKMLDHASDLGCLGIKQLQAYSRNLDFELVRESELKFRGKLSEAEIKRFQDWIIHTLCELAHDRKWPHQVHVGTHNHPDSNPLPLGKLAERYPAQNLVLLHCWPYLEESGFLAQAYPHVYVDTCWQPMLNPDFLRRSLDTWLAYIPLNKWTMSNDSTSVEMAVGASMITRRILGEELLKHQSGAGIDDRGLREIAAQFLHNNAVEIYKHGEIHLT